MLVECPPPPPVAFRNFNLCPHCSTKGQQPLLCRLSEGLPMISRSDGRTFHLFLADRPLPYPLERSAGASNKISACFWYAHDREPGSTLSTIVILLGSRVNHPSLFRKIEQVADLLAEELMRNLQLADLYEYIEDSEQSLAVF